MVYTKQGKWFRWTSHGRARSNKVAVDAIVVVRGVMVEVVTAAAVVVVVKVIVMMMLVIVVDSS